MYRQSEKKLVKQQYVLHMSPQYDELRPISGWDPSDSLRHPCEFQRVSRFGSVTARRLVVGVSQTLRRWTERASWRCSCIWRDKKSMILSLRRALISAMLISWSASRMHLSQHRPSRLRKHSVSCNHRPVYSASTTVVGICEFSCIMWSVYKLIKLINFSNINPVLRIFKK